ncbi:MAG: fatty acid desaturase, partial [Planctomycetota bacterium]
HTGWFMTPAAYHTKSKFVPDLLRYPELRFLDRFDWLAPLSLAAGLFAFGWALSGTAAGGAQMLVWGFAVSTVALYHASFTINSLAHRFGSRRFETKDDSRNNLLLALLTFGEGWHNNHHHHSSSVRQGFYWWEFDLTYYLLFLLSRLGLVWDLKPVPKRALERNRVR